MKFPALLLILPLLLPATTEAADDGYALTEYKKAPAKLAKPIAALMESTGYEVSFKKKPFCRVWLRKAVPVKADFAPDFMVKYPFKSGELLGVMEVPAGVKVKDFRGQEMKPGTYTLRYGLQPEDGNHIGTSDTSDFILALPAGDKDKSPDTVKSEETLFKNSAKSVGSTHPAIFSLQEAEKAPAKTTLVHNEDKEFQIIHAALTGSNKKKLGLKMVIVGQSEG